MLGKGRTEHSSVFRSSVRSHATHAIGELKNKKTCHEVDEHFIVFIALVFFDDLKLWRVRLYEASE